ncbi:DUF1330 domain-containing protein [Shewanella avicenniae]|uniref:DUF1330 domain-containing protein n=1 Tax=Shewanella avicenniae TaxID=2814294 RepID=A0ABX7QMW7_9GAMM|nr:DUF1330 domain-containing protein [Shewanella avicenniae]QSX32105.1 DUF1330 domain-containing protein [Shewanella avicenniae]
MHQATNPAYVIIDISVNDPDGMKPYQERVEATYKAFGGKRLVLAGKLETLEGSVPKGMIVMLQFDSVEQAHAWHESPAYQEIINYRQSASSSNIWLVEGVIPELQ